MSSGARNWVDKKKSEQKKKVPRRRRLTATNFVPGQTTNFLVKVFAFLSLLQPSKTFSYVFHFHIHNLSKRPSEENNFRIKVFLKKKKSKKKYSFFFSIFFFDFLFFEFFFPLTKTYTTPFSFYFIAIYLLPTTKKTIDAWLDQYIIIK